MHDIGSLIEVLRLAQAEGALEGEGLEAFAKGLRERAELVIEERLGRAEEQVRRLEAEVAWRQQTIRQLEQENAWRRETNEALAAELTALRAARDAAVGAHDRLLSHHRDVLGRVAAELAAIAALPLYSLRSVRRRVTSL